MVARLRPWWQKIKQHPVATVLTALLVVVIVLVVLSVLGYIFNWNWTGLSSYIPPTKASNFQRGKTLWDWLQLLIIPAVLAVAGYVINLTISRGEQAATEQRAQSEREATDKRAETEREIALDNQREAALQAYINEMSELLLHEKLRWSKPEAEVRKIARVRTLIVLPRLDGKRKSSILQFLFESGLIEKDHTIIDISEADLSRANLFGANLSGACLKQTILEEANLMVALLDDADLFLAKLNKANLVHARMSGVNLCGADLEEADLRGAVMKNTDLSRADLRNANLYEAKVTEEQLKTARSLKGATMPDGSIHS